MKARPFDRPDFWSEIRRMKSTGSVPSSVPTSAKPCPRARGRRSLHFLCRRWMGALSQALPGITASRPIALSATCQTPLHSTAAPPAESSRRGRPGLLAPGRKGPSRSWNPPLFALAPRDLPLRLGRCQPSERSRRCPLCRREVDGVRVRAALPSCLAVPRTRPTPFDASLSTEPPTSFLSKPGLVPAEREPAHRHRGTAGVPPGQLAPSALLALHRGLAGIRLGRAAGGASRPSHAPPGACGPPTFGSSAPTPATTSASAGPLPYSPACSCGSRSPNPARGSSHHLPGCGGYAYAPPFSATSASTSGAGATPEEGGGGVCGGATRGGRGGGLRAHKGRQGELGAYSSVG